MVDQLRGMSIGGRTVAPPKAQQQRAIWTAYDRYPTIFAAVARNAPKRGRRRRLQVLSYGCSTGEEPHTLAMRYFPRDHIVGLDISEAALERARERFKSRRIVYDKSTSRALTEHGPYDIIFAMSVLCRWPRTRELEDCSEVYTFRRFSRAIAALDRSLRVGGLLVVYNANFSVLETPTAKRYEVVPDPSIRRNGFVHRFDRSNKRDNRARADCIYRKLADA